MGMGRPLRDPVMMRMGIVESLGFCVRFSIVPHSEE
jgi:hypothetical protein